MHKDPVVGHDVYSKSRVIPKLTYTVCDSDHQRFITPDYHPRFPGRIACHNLTDLHFTRSATALLRFMREVSIGTQVLVTLLLDGLKIGIDHLFRFPVAVKPSLPYPDGP